MPASRLATLPRDVRTVVETMLEKDPTRRYRSASAVAEDLRRLRAREPIAARGIGPWLRAQRAVERRPVVALFGPSCPQEIDFYGRGEAVVSPADCGPCYRAQCNRDPTCMDAIEPARVVDAVKRWTAERQAGRKQAISGN